MKIKLIISGLILATCAVFIALSLPPKSVAVETPPAPEVVVIDTPEPEPEPQPAPAPSAPTYSSEGTSAQEQELINLHNNYRASQNLNQLSVNQTLMLTAQVKANDMCNRSYFAHADPDGNHAYYWMAYFGYYYNGAGENLARKYRMMTNTFNGFLASPTHLSNIVGNYNEIGVGFNNCGGVNYVAVHYGLR